MSKLHRVKRAESHIHRHKSAGQVDLMIWLEAIKVSLSQAQQVEVAKIAAKDDQAGFVRLMEYGQIANPEAYQVVVEELRRREAESLAG